MHAGWLHFKQKWKRGCKIDQYTKNMLLFLGIFSGVTVSVVSSSDCESISKSGKKESILSAFDSNVSLWTSCCVVISVCVMLSTSIGWEIVWHPLETKTFRYLVFVPLLITRFVKSVDLSILTISSVWIAISQCLLHCSWACPTSGTYAKILSTN